MTVTGSPECRAQLCAREEAAALVSIKSLAKNTRGDAIVEAAILFPIMILIFAGLILLAVYLPTRSALQRATQLAATAVATECSDSWLFADPNTASCSWSMRKDELKNVYAALFPNSIEIDDKANKLVNLAESRRLGSDENALTVECFLVNRIIYEEIIVTASRNFAFPFSLSMFGIKDSISVSVTSTAVVQNADEFVRNVDLAIDFAGYIREKFGLTDIAESIAAPGEIITALLGWK